MPHFVRYRIYAPIVRLIMYRMAKYRVKVVERNLKRCFPERSDEERNEIKERFYTYLSETVISTLSLPCGWKNWRDAYPKGQNIGDKEAESKHGTLENLRRELNGESAIVLTAHFGLWEYIIFFEKFAGTTSIGAYRPLENKIIDELFRRFRTRKRAFALPSGELARFAMRHGKKYEGEGYILGLIADQNPLLKRDTKWYRFLATETIFFDGADRIAMKVGLPVYYMYQVRTAPGRYELRYENIWDAKEEIESGEITRRYVRHLNKSVRNTPELWVWSHRRFKKNKAWQMRAYKLESEPETIE